MENSINIGILTVEQTFEIKKRMFLQVMDNIWTAIKVAAVLLTFLGVATAAKQYTSHLPIPVKMQMTKTAVLTVSQETLQLTKALQFLKCPDHKIGPITEGILKAARTIGVQPKFILALLFTESQFNLKAKSPLGYSGLMQTPRASMEYADVDILYGARILEEKMKSPAALGTNGRVDMRKALAMYKGGLNPMAFKYADETLRLYKKLNTLGG